jgi:hypothetical protein
MLATSATRAPLLIGTWSGHGEVVRVGGAWPRAIAIIATSATKTPIAAALIGLGATTGIGTASNDCQPTFISQPQHLPPPGAALWFGVERSGDRCEPTARVE